MKSDRNNFTFFGHKHPLLRVNLISSPLVYIGVNIYIRIWFLQTLMGPILYSKDKKTLLLVKKDPYYRGVINPAAKKCCCWGKLPIHARCNCNISESIVYKVFWGNIIVTTDFRNC